MGHFGAEADFERFSEVGGVLYEGLERIRATVDSADGLITVVVGGRGEVLELELDPRIYHVPDADALAKSIMDTIRVAYDDAAKASLNLIDKLTGESDSRVRPLLERIHEALDPDHG